MTDTAKDSDANSCYNDSTLAVHTSISPSGNQEHSTALYLNSGFRFNDSEHARAVFANEVPGHKYGRYHNPNTDEFIAKVCALEQLPAGVAMASGMGAIFTVFMALLSKGDHIIASRAVFGSTFHLLQYQLPRWGIDVTLIDGKDNQAWQTAMQRNTRICYLETPSNPGLELVDLEFVGTLCHKQQVILMVDNIFATPLLQKPARYGADLVMHSATKFLDGQGRCLGGVVAGKTTWIEQIRQFNRHAGCTLSAFNAWVFSKGIETLAIRMDKHCSNALRLAEFLQQHPQVQQVRYPYLPTHPQYTLARRQMSAGGALVTFKLRDLHQARTCMDRLQMLTLSANLGDTRTIVTHPASTTHSSLTQEQRLATGVTDGLIRISVGLEDVEDIIYDLDQALSPLP